MSNFETVVQQAIYSKLAGDTPLNAVVTGIYDDYIQTIDPGNSANYPFVSIGEDNHVTVDTDTELMNQVSITVHTWSRYRGRVETKQIQGLIYDALHRAALTATGYKFITITQESSESQLDADGLTRHGIQTFNLLIEEV
jgi:hypothetical protein